LDCRRGATPVQNVVNLDAAFAAATDVSSMTDPAVAPITSAPLVWIALAMVTVGETLVGALSH
jgi:hypothetical protein